MSNDNKEPKSSDGVSELREQISKTMGWWSPDGFDAYPEKTDKVIQLIHDHDQRIVAEARKQAASDIFNLAHKYAQEDDTLIGSEDLRGYHYFNAIHKIGEFDGR